MMSPQRLDLLSYAESKGRIKSVYKSKIVALLPDITDNDEPAEARSPFFSPSAKVG